MRMWMVEPKKMCRKHLMGEHVELHMFVGTLNAGRKVNGYLKNGLLEVDKIWERHEAIVIEITRRGYRHRSPLDQVVVSDVLVKALKYNQTHRINVEKNEKNLRKRCKICKMLQENYDKQGH